MVEHQPTRFQDDTGLVTGFMDTGIKDDALPKLMP